MEKIHTLIDDNEHKQHTKFKMGKTSPELASNFSVKCGNL